MFLHLTLLLCLFSPNVNTVLTMMKVWGIPSNISNALVYKNTTWDECIRTCFSNDGCVLAYQSGNTTCLNFVYYQMPNVIKTNSKNGSVVAFKVDSPGELCPVGSDAPTFNGTPAEGSLYIKNDSLSSNPKWIYYIVQLSMNYSCTGQQQYVEHSDGTGYCIITYVANEIKGSSYADGVTNCNYQGMTLASLFYPEDLSQFMTQAAKYRSVLSNTNTAIRLDGKRTSECQSTPTTAACMTVDGFNWTGPVPETFDNYDWVTNAGAQATSDDNCIVLIMNGTEQVRADVQGCNATSPLPAGMYQCGLIAWNNALVG